MKKFFKAVWIFIPLALAAAMYFILPYFPDFTEYVCSRGLFKLVTVPIGFVTSLIPVSLTELLVILALPLVIFLIVLLIVKLKKSKKRGKTLLGAGRFLCGFLSFASLLYMVCHGANYYRYPIERIMELDTSQKSPEFLLSVCGELAKGAAEARKELETDENGCMRFSESVFEELTRTGSGYDKLVEEYPFLWTAIWRQKPVMLSEPWSYTHITGMFFPFFAECNVNTAQPDFSIPYTAAHESAHSRGVAFENECNFLAFLSCINSEYPEFRYSGYMEAFKYCSNALFRYDLEMWQQAHDLLTEEMIADFNAENEYILTHEAHLKVKVGSTSVTVSVSEVSEAVNDGFIKVQGVAEGTLSYGRVTELILAYYADKL
ncbi:MAG: DUF3810 domain-containing protein [Lachnospiraceae bacterium]|nr:DUF3810 domain-containing protein [Ruminococcus sp.]MCM1275966.1 DUF3810 domain-containing protein [Lachnospiraceae bacterium]